MATQTLDIHSDIRKADDAFETKFSMQDAAGIAELYTENAMVFPAGSDIIKGKNAIQEFWKAVMDLLGIREVKLDIVEVELHDAVATEVGRYQLIGDGGEVKDQGKYIVIWKQEGGQWKIHRDIWNTSQPA
jgi:ketosteroid isomerase-like protein